MNNHAVVMVDILIRGVDKDAAAALSEMARRRRMSRMQFIRDILTTVAQKGEEQKAKSSPEEN